MQMGRPARFTTPQFVDATKRLVARGGPAAATIAAIADEAGAPVGSIYHRLRSRELLLAELWLEVVEDFQQGFFAALSEGDTRAAGLTAALHGPRWARKHPTEARVLLLHRREEFLSGDWPPEVAARAKRLGSDMDRAIRDFTRRSLGRATGANLRRVKFAIADVPLAAVRRHVADGERPPDIVDDLIRETYRAVLAVR